MNKYNAQLMLILTFLLMCLFAWVCIVLMLNSGLNFIENIWMRLIW